MTNELQRGKGSEVTHNWVGMARALGLAAAHRPLVEEPNFTLKQTRNLPCETR
ncbi:hypothetical protein TcasGA2_TC004529 [Tribolium castaneum]|uniref:Uncharacterized protein n=1 Tax=Tribolium castaneum TaxID=7070 RepID=D6WBJ4_TRICA|nr:hypothetical protein TcasGA2_TC004529 [Tribolium castaneum]